MYLGHNLSDAVDVVETIALKGFIVPWISTHVEFFLHVYLPNARFSLNV